MTELEIKATLRADNTTIPAGGSVTLTCDLKHSGDFEYQWFTETSSKSRCTLEVGSDKQISISKGGIYSCRGRRKKLNSLTIESDPVTIQETDKPRPVLTVSPSWLSPGASVTLNCEVEHPSAGWSFYWYKAVPDLSEKSSSYELLPDGSGTAQDSYIIHGQTHTAGYVCRAGRGDPEYHTDHSQPKFVWSADVHSAASLTVSPDRVQHFTSDSVSLTCEGNFTEWRVRKFSEDGRLYSDCRRMTGSTCNIITSKSDTAVYWCESGSGEFSSAVNITVQISKCLLSMFTITVAPSGPESSSSPLWLVVGLVFGVSLLIILLLLMFHYTKAKDVCFTGPIQSDINSQDSTRNHGVNQDETHEYKSIQHGEYELYETVHPSEDTADGPNGDHHIYETIHDMIKTTNEADKAHEATYSLSDLKNYLKDISPS
ncbi:unnamed protein product [Oreochromis niloticus]|nr:unnamed protein product [Mustela putorius furo]